MLDERDSKSEETWDSIAESFDLTRRKPWMQCIDFIDTLSKTDTVVDLGCGNGRHLLQCAEHCKEVIGLDISKELIDITKRKLKEKNLDNTVLLHADMVNIPLKNDTVDSILFIAALHNIKGKDRRIQSLKEVKRVLKKDGTALISVWSRWQDKYRKHFLKKWFTKKGQTEFGDIDIYWRQNGLNIPRFYHLYSRKEFIEDIKKAGLKIEKIEDVKIASQKYPDNYFAVVTKR
ncbi:MAG: methyltransferase domain-containing protein [Euryarchaeota archaeon]|nr:methyltransferase domain-containing protein [Euryarchaeota archaeon]